MQTYKYPERDQWEGIVKRPSLETALLEKQVRKIIGKVRLKGDKAVKNYSKEFDGITIRKLAVAQKEIIKAGSLLSDELKHAIHQAKMNIESFHRSQKEETKKIETMPGVSCWQKSVPIEKIGLYIPGGTAPLFSTVLMLGVPAQLAGCREIIICTPPLSERRASEQRERLERISGGEAYPAILYAAQLCGIKKVFKIGGAQAIAAMAYGTESVPKVFKIFGPGNQYVTLAKQLVQLEGVAIDMPAGPSELLIIADNTAVPEFVAADLLSQTEHGPDSQVILVTTSLLLLEKVKLEIRKQVKQLPRKEIAESSLANSKFVLVNEMKVAIELLNLYSPEHVMISCKDPEIIAEQVNNAGSVFLGNYSPVSVGDYASGTNHVLPTHSYSAMYSGVSLDSFMKKITYQELTRKGLESISNTVMTMATAEGLGAHRRSVSIRLNK